MTCGQVVLSMVLFPGRFVRVFPPHSDPSRTLGQQFGREELGLCGVRLLLLFSCSLSFVDKSCRIVRCLLGC